MKYRSRDEHLFIRLDRKRSKGNNLRFRALCSCGEYTMWSGDPVSARSDQAYHDYMQKVRQVITA